VRDKQTVRDFQRLLPLLEERAELRQRGPASGSFERALERGVVGVDPT
jgi:hypothetical protein